MPPASGTSRPEPTDPDTRSTFSVSIPALTLEVGLLHAGDRVLGAGRRDGVPGGRHQHVRAPPADPDQTGQHHAQARRHARKRRCSQWFQATVVKVRADRPLDQRPGRRRQHRCRRGRSANAYPVKWTGSDLNAGGNEFLTQSLEIAHSRHEGDVTADGRESALPPELRPRLPRDRGRREARLLLQPDRVLDREDEHLGSREGQRQVLSEPEVHERQRRARWS